MTRYDVLLKLSLLVVLIKLAYSLLRRKKIKTEYMQKSRRQAKWPRYASKYPALLNSI
jgi:heme exporter protein D